MYLETFVFQKKNEKKIIKYLRGIIILCQPFYLEVYNFIFSLQQQ